MYPNEISASSRNTKDAPQAMSSNGSVAVDGVSCGCSNGSGRNCGCSNCQKRHPRNERRT
ncbi:GD17904 [Drosophila simulans]|uniref:GD17904 n=1 Tax=Drosophila simulans TaxID=7240 RepID=B4QGL4_DROSI|nr:GD17904 [Drosophila simulans]